MFTAGSPDWFVRTMYDDSKVVLMVWAEDDTLVGVASSEESLKALLDDVATDLQKAGKTGGDYAVVGLNRIKGKEKVLRLTAHITTRKSDGELVCSFGREKIARRKK